MQSVEIMGKPLFYNDNGCNVENWVKEGKLYGRHNYDLLMKLVLVEGWLLDAGAHIGTFSFLPALQGLPVIAIEGCHNNVVCLRQTFNGTTVEVHEAILAECEKRCRFSRDTGPFGWMIEDEDGDCVTQTIDHIVGGRFISGMKLDIEGGEIAALDGAKNTLAFSRPPIVMEVNGFCLMQHGHRSEDLLFKVAQHGYRSYVIVANQLYSVDPSALFPFCNTDVICIHQANLHQYAFANARSLEGFEIDDLAQLICQQSNDDCKSYFKMIGIE